jgi:mannan endo-1,6-alpha-mannosidase
LTPTFTTFFPSKYGNNIMSEISCETQENCDGNMVCYKGFLSAWLVFTSLIAPYTYPQILPKLQASAQAAAKTCTGPPDGTRCGVSWVKESYDGLGGLGQQLSVLSVFSSNLIAFTGEKAPLTAATGGTSESDPSSGLGSPSPDLQPQQMNINTADRAGAGILTAVFVSAWIGMIGWLVIGR